MTSIHHSKRETCFSWFCPREMMGIFIGGSLGAWAFGPSVPIVGLCATIGAIAISIIRALPQETSKAICVHKWISNQKEIHLLRREKDFEFLVVDRINKATQRGLIPCGDKSPEQVLSFLQQCHATLKIDGSPFFSKPAAYFKWEVICVREQLTAYDSIDDFDPGVPNAGAEYLQSQGELSLIQNEQNLLTWHLVDKSLHVSSQLLLSEDESYFDQDCVDIASIKKEINAIHKKADQLYPADVETKGIDAQYLPKEKLEQRIVRYQNQRSYINPAKAEIYNNHIPLNMRLAFLKNFSGAQVSIHKHYLNINSLFFKPVTVLSRLDKKVKITWETWAVTLVNTGSSRCDPLTWGGHAGIVIEGIRQGQYFMQFAHFRQENGGTVLLHDEDHNPYSPDDIVKKCKGKTETWAKGYKDVQRMIANISYQRDNKSAAPKFKIFGHDSIFAHPSEEHYFSEEFHNCITWALKELHFIGIDLPKDPASWLITTPTKYTKI